MPRVKNAPQRIKSAKKLLTFLGLEIFHQEPRVQISPKLQLFCKDVYRQLQDYKYNSRRGCVEEFFLPLATAVGLGGNYLRISDRLPEFLIVMWRTISDSAGPCQLDTALDVFASALRFDRSWLFIEGGYLVSSAEFTQRFDAKVRIELLKHARKEDAMPSAEELSWSDDRIAKLARGDRIFERQLRYEFAVARWRSNLENFCAILDLAEKGLLVDTGKRRKGLILWQAARR
jgi:hypothetical protein